MTEPLETESQSQDGPRPRVRDASEAIAAKKAQAEANRTRIAAAISTLQVAGEPVNVQSVARTADVHPDTVRRNPDLYAEVRHLRDQVLQRPPTKRNASDAAPYEAMKARWLTAQGEVAQLREELAQARRAAHQALGQAGTLVTPETADELRRENVELRVRLGEVDEEVRVLREERSALSGELLAAHEINRDYVRDLTRTKEQLLLAEQERNRLRSQIRH